MWNLNSFAKNSVNCHDTTRECRTFKIRSIAVEHCRVRHSIVHRRLCRTFVDLPNCMHAIGHCANRRQCHCRDLHLIAAQPLHKIVLPHSWQRSKCYRDPSDSLWSSPTMRPTKTNCLNLWEWPMCRSRSMDHLSARGQSPARGENVAWKWLRSIALDHWWHLFRAQSAFEVIYL